jgi:hypothetical protein
MRKVFQSWKVIRAPEAEKEILQDDSYNYSIY